MKFWWGVTWGLVMFSGLAETSEVLAQINPILPAPINPQIPDFPELPPLPDALKDPTPSVPRPPLFNPPETQPVPGERFEQFVVREFKILGSTVFSEEDFQAIADPYLNRPIHFSDLQAIQAQITDLYINNGYITSGAILPVEPVTPEGIATIQISEGQIEAIEISGNDRLRSSYIRDRIALGVKTPLNVDQLLKSLRVLQVNPLIESLSTELSPSQQPGLSVLLVSVTEADAKDLRLSLNNHRPTNIGSFQRRVEFEERNLTGHGDTARVLYGNTDGSNEVEARYEIPINARDGSVDIAFRQIWSRVIEEPFDRLDLKGRSRSLSVGFRQPVIKSPQQELAVGIQLGRRESETEFLGRLSPISPGADNNGQTQVTGLNFIQEWVRRNRNSILALRSDFGIGLDAFATDNPTPPDGEFVLWRGQVQYVRQFAPATQLQIRSNLQFADRSLVSGEQFGLGGAQTVRGYPQNLLLVDNGLTASVEASVPLLGIQNRRGLLQAVPFLDFGHGFNSNEPIAGSNSLLAVGLGLRWQWSDRINAQINWGIPLISTDTVSRGFSDSQIFFTIDAKLF